MPDVEIRRWNELASGPRRDRLIADIEHVFFSSSARQSFETATEKAAFRERWLGRYLEHFPQHALVAVDKERRAVGYIIGSLEDPARDPLFADVTALAHFRALTPRYPAQLHININADWRGHGLGARLLAAFSDMARDGGAPGVHAITARGLRNVGFYLANDFVEHGAVDIDGRELLFLGRDLAR
ncbi:GNAT family N-acetyltransferase [Hyphomicrobium sp. CS1GBMeth3]|uniref:GNAT family N-acetyltransferase n=1 Tax=Hyphomicrobium sp. CS1GBMeth3 TaxID=1892845 RepID=UPI0009311063|nr:GNAT family N-acetyltransferase [Hyphomicrobium sp. CS1GBMeth3]